MTTPSTSYRTIELTQGKVTIVNEKHYDWLSQWKWCAQRNNDNFYAVRTFWIGNHCFGLKMHRVILGLTAGDKRLVDHVNLDGLDNREENLRIATTSKNAMNRHVTKISKSGLKGVFFYRGKWRASIGLNNRDIFLGDYATTELTHEAYCEAAAKYHGKFARFA